MKEAAAYVCCLVIFLLPLVSGDSDACDDMFASARLSLDRAKGSIGKSNNLLNKAHGNGRREMCSYLRAFIETNGRDKCASLISHTCPVLVKTRLVKTIGGIPDGCETCAPVCNSSISYRTIDGSCNNLMYPRWGKAGIHQRRLLRNAYDDGRGSPRTKACNNLRLPSARTVSNMIHNAGTTKETEPYLSLMVMQMGQFLTHDLVQTNVFTRHDGSPLDCCNTERNNTNCNPIEIPLHDPNFPARSCMNFERSRASTDCSFVRQVLNSQTSYLDLSMVYGTSGEKAKLLRSFDNGKLQHVQNKLPVDLLDLTCVLSKPFDRINYYCPIAGDLRVNEQPGLALIHTLFMREHNRLAEGLAKINPLWDDERLYQEARKINIGQWQNIVYSEYLPSILGPDVINRFNLIVQEQDHHDYYDPYVDATISNALAVAAFRFGHSLVPDVIGMLDIKENHLTIQPLEQHYFETEWYHIGNGSGLENILNWMTTTACPFSDGKLQDSVRQRLFQDREGNSFDLAALDIHRGRDHGTPGYAAFRTFCGLSAVTHFGTGLDGLINHDTEAAAALKKTYACPSDIDLFTGLLTERRTPGSLLGPTWECIIGQEFKRLRDGDRFFYERKDPLNPDIGFTLDQLNSIKRVKTSDIICQNSEKLSVQPDVFSQSQETSSNSYQPCNTFPGVNLSLWKENMSGEP